MYRGVQYSKNCLSVSMYSTTDVHRKPISRKVGFLVMFSVNWITFSAGAIWWKLCNLPKSLDLILKSSQEALNDLNSITRNRFLLLKRSSLFVQDYFSICLLSIEKAIFWAWVSKAKTANCQSIEMNKFRSGHGVIQESKWPRAQYARKMWKSSLFLLLGPPSDTKMEDFGEFGNALQTRKVWKRWLTV